MQIEHYLADLIRPLLTEPDALTIVRTHDDMGTLITLTVAKPDMGVLVGKEGQTAKSVRHLVRVVGVRHGMRVSVKITEPDGSPYIPRQRALADSE